MRVLSLSKALIYPWYWLNTQEGMTYGISSKVVDRIFFFRNTVRHNFFLLHFKCMILCIAFDPLSRTTFAFFHYFWPQSLNNVCFQLILVDVFSTCNVLCLIHYETMPMQYTEIFIKL